jgi:hypothetical protein
VAVAVPGLVRVPVSQFHCSRPEASAVLAPSPVDWLGPTGADSVEPLTVPLTEPRAPWKPGRLAVSVPKRKSTLTRPNGPILGDPKVSEHGEAVLDSRGRPGRELLGWRTPGKEVLCWDLPFVVDGHQFFERFPKGRPGRSRAAASAGISIPPTLIVPFRAIGSRHASVRAANSRGIRVRQSSPSREASPAGAPEPVGVGDLVAAAVRPTVNPLTWSSRSPRA